MPNTQYLISNTQYPGIRYRVSGIGYSTEESMKNHILLKVREVSHLFEDAHPVWALRDVNLVARGGEFVALVGPSGCGKSTLLRIMAGLISPHQGEVYVDGQPLRGPRADVGMVFQHANLMPWRTVLANVRLPLEILGVPAGEADARARAFITLVGLDGFERAYPRQLSGGMQQRVALARALVHDPRLLLLDEPFASLDALTRERMNLELLRIWAHHRQTAIMVTHSIAEAVFVADRVLVMTPRPGHIAGEVEVNLPRPRALEMMAWPEFGQLTQQVRNLIAAAQ